MKSKTIKYECANCDHIEVMSKKEVRGKIIGRLFRDIFISLGAFFALALIVAGPVTISESIANGYLTRQAGLDTEELRRVAINVTELCVEERSTNSYCYAKHIYNHLDDMRYVPASYFKMIVDPEDIYEYGGDCKNMAFLYVAMMKSVGFTARMECRMAEEHCVVVVPRVVDFEKQPGFAVVDLTIPGFYAMDDGDDIWMYRAIGDRWE